MGWFDSEINVTYQQSKLLQICISCSAGSKNSYSSANIYLIEFDNLKLQDLISTFPRRGSRVIDLARGAGLRNPIATASPNVNRQRADGLGWVLLSDYCVGSINSLHVGLLNFGVFCSSLFAIDVLNTVRTNEKMCFCSFMDCNKFMKKYVLLYTSIK